VKQIEAEEKMYGNIIVPDMGKDKPMIGKVLAAGPGTYMGATLIPMAVKVGDVVFYPPFGGNKITWESEEYVIVKDADVLAILKEVTKPVPAILKGEIISDLLSDTAETMGQNTTSVQLGRLI
jgi:chaperonin GroES